MSTTIQESDVQVPADFEVERQRVHAYLDRSITYSWISVRKRGQVPRDACCVVLCGKTAKQEATARCLAFAHEHNGRFHWFGIVGSHQEPVELYGVTGFVPVAEAATVLFG